MSGFITVKNIVIGQGVPKICVPILGETEEEILHKAKEVKDLCVDMIEWRGDFYQDILEQGRVNQLLSQLRMILEDKVLLFTFRTKKEGGEREITTSQYVTMNKGVMNSGQVDLIDVELFTGADEVRQLVEFARENQVKVIISNHDFEKTPPKNEMLKRMEEMKNLGGDIIKIAVMPHTSLDVLELLTVTNEASQVFKIPVITMSMSSLGMISRVSGETFGSAVTFGAHGDVSAPGQIPVDELEGILKSLHMGGNTLL